MMLSLFSFWQRRTSCAGVLVALTLLMGLPACSVLPKSEPVDVYLMPELSPRPRAPQPAVPWSLRVSLPAGSTHLASQRILVVAQAQRVSAYHGAKWSDPAPWLLRNRMLDAFRLDGRVNALSSDDKVLQADFVLDTELRAFQSEYRAGVPEVVIRLDARLVQSDTRRIVASRHFDVRQAAPGAALPEVVQAFGQATDRVATDLVAWVMAQAAQVP